MKKLAKNLDAIADRIRITLSEKDKAREKVLPLCRELIRYSSITIRAIHRQEFEQAKELLNKARQLRDEIKEATRDWDDLRYSGSVRDAQKEFAEASITLALVLGKLLPKPESLDIDLAAYLNGMGEAVGELRRYMLDGMRHGDLTRGEELLSAMDDIYSALVTMDFPDAITAGLRHTTDNVRGILERTRGDLTLAFRERSLESRLDRQEHQE